MSELPKLPKLPRASKGGGPRKARQPDEVIERPREGDEVSAAPENFEDRIGIDPTKAGRWFETGRQEGAIGGRCGRCGRLRKAENLITYMIPFTSDEIWVCKEGDC